jgi:hypothetical protein
MPKPARLANLLEREGLDALPSWSVSRHNRCPLVRPNVLPLSSGRIRKRRAFGREGTLQNTTRCGDCLGKVETIAWSVVKARLEESLRSP